MCDIGLFTMSQNDADLLTDNLRALRDDLRYSNNESVGDLARRLRHGLQKVGALLSTANKARSIIVPKQHVLSTFELPGTMLPGGCVSDNVHHHVAGLLEEEKNNLTVMYNMKVGELLSLACERAFISPGGSEAALIRNKAEWELLLLDTAKELSDLSQQIAMSVTSAELVAKELRGCRKRERDSRQPGAGTAYQSEPFRPRPVVGSPADVLVEEALQNVGMVYDAPVANVVPTARASTRAVKRKQGGISERELRSLQVD
jgi:hypothetical protein